MSVAFIRHESFHVTNSRVRLVFIWQAESIRYGDFEFHTSFKYQHTTMTRLTFSPITCELTMSDHYELYFMVTDFWKTVQVRLGNA